MVGPIHSEVRVIIMIVTQNMINYINYIVFTAMLRGCLHKGILEVRSIYPNSLTSVTGADSIKAVRFGRNQPSLGVIWGSYGGHMGIILGSYGCHRGSYGGHIGV